MYRDISATTLPSSFSPVAVNCFCCLRHVCGMVSRADIGYVQRFSSNYAAGVGRIPGLWQPARSAERRSRQRLSKDPIAAAGYLMCECVKDSDAHTCGIFFPPIPTR